MAKFHAVSYAIINEVGVAEFKRNWELNIIEFVDESKNALITSLLDNGPMNCVLILKVRGVCMTLHLLTNFFTCRTIRQKFQKTPLNICQELLLVLQKELRSC